MEQKVLLYDADGAKIGETFTRRAAQLVKKQRAAWTDDTRAAVRFTADAAVTEAEKSELLDVRLPEAQTAPTDAQIVALAEKRIKERSNFIYHSLAFLPGWAFLLIAANIFSDFADPFAVFCFTSGSWLTAYLIHVYQFSRGRVKLFSTGKEERKARREQRKAQKLACEIALLKSELRA